MTSRTIGVANRAMVEPGILPIGCIFMTRTAGAGEVIGRLVFQMTSGAIRCANFAVIKNCLLPVCCVLVTGRAFAVEVIRRFILQMACRA